MSALVELACAQPLLVGVGRVTRVGAAAIEASGPSARLGDMCEIRTRGGPIVRAEVIGLRRGTVLLMPCGNATGVGLDDEVRSCGAANTVLASEAMLGRVVDAFGQPVDDLGPLPGPFTPMAVRPEPLNPLSRPAVDEPVHTGIRVVDTLLTLGRGQRIGIFAGSGVGKSSLLGMLARNAQADVQVLALIGERGREVRDFLERHLGAEGLRRSVVVVATSDQPAVVRARAALTATSVAEYFRDRGRSVFLMMDSVTRFAMARREIDLAAGQPPTARGYTPAVFSQIPALCERAGTSDSGGSITGIYTVLVEGDDHTEPVADTLRATLDGHIFLSRDLANEGHFPAVDVLHSVSRLASELVDTRCRDLQSQARSVMALYERHREMVEMGLYKPGGNRELDRALSQLEGLRSFLRQSIDEVCPVDAAWQALADVLAQGEARRA